MNAPVAYQQTKRRKVVTSENKGYASLLFSKNQRSQLEIFECSRNFRLMFSTPLILLLSSLFFIVMTRHLDFRERFLERKRLRTLKDQRIKVLNKFVLRNTEILDDITHYMKVKGKSIKASKKVRAIEKDFRRLLAMDGMKYNYKRDLFWRTWREMPRVNNATDQIVCYKCNNPIYVNVTNCHNCGMWTIEDQPPPCPFEFFSVISSEELCGADYKQYKDVNNTCPSIIKFSDLTATCENPIETQWRFTKMYGVTQKYNDVICKNRDFCEILTLYDITPEHVVFRIINSTNDVIYSRIMKPKKRNYICVNDCGRFNPNTRKVTKVDKPLKLDLLGKRKKKKAKVRNGMNEKVTKRSVMNERITKRNVLNDVHVSATKGGVFLEETNVSVTKRAVSYENYNNDIQGTYAPRKKKQEKEILNDILSEEDHMLESSNQNDFIIVSIEENALHKIKSKRMKKKQNTVVYKEGITLKPTVTPGYNSQEGGHISIEELENAEFE